MRRIVAACSLLVLILSLAASRPSAQPLPTVSADLLALRARGERMKIIVQGAEPGESLIGRARGLLRRELQGGLALEVSKDEFDALTKDGSFAHISRDIPVVGDMAVTNTVTGATAVWAGDSGLLGLFGSSGYRGDGIVVAVLDSGIAQHTALDSRVIARVNFVSSEPPATGDPYGHGTHVAGIIAGSTTAAKYVTPAFAGGSAPGVKLVDVRVLGRTGMGMTSDVIAGIDWAISNRSKYGIRVLNLSLGHPVAEAEATDPLCRAVKRAAEAGIVVVASAGNHGQTSTGAPILGGVTSPGNSQFAITVGAIDTMGTVDRSDDRVAPYSSRGPTRFDFAVKPDVVAPGTRITSLEANGSYIASTYPAWHIAGNGKNAYVRLSGTSMSTAVVSGGAALLLDAHPGMTPAQVKVALQMGSVYSTRDGLVGAGAGSVNFQSSMKVADRGLLTSVLGTVTSVLGLSSGLAFHDTSAGTLINRIYDRTGVRLLALLELPILFGSPDGGEPGVLNLLGLGNPIASVAPNYVVWGDMAGWTGSYYVVWGDTLQSPSGQYVVWGDSIDDRDYVVWGNSLDPDRPKRE
jgi:serine protease AprX